MSTGWDPEELQGDDDEDELDVETDLYKDSVIFCIEISESMILCTTPIESNDDEPPKKKKKTSSENSSNLLAALKCIQVFMRRKIVGNPKDLLGIMLFNTNETKGVGGETFDNIFILRDLGEIDAPDIQMMRDLIISAEKDPNYLSREFKPFTGANRIGEAFFACNSMFRTRSSKLSSKRIFLITDNDDPFPDTMRNVDVMQLRKSAWMRANDLYEIGFLVQPFFIERDPTKPFDTSKFYEVCLQSHVNLAEDPIDMYKLRGGEDSYDDLLAATKLLQTPKRAVFTLPFILGKGWTIGIQGFSEVTTARIRQHVMFDLSSHTAREVKAKTIYIDKDFGVTLDPKQSIKTYYPIGGKAKSDEIKIVMSPEETTELKTFGIKPCLRLLGFKNYDDVPTTWYKKHSYFIYPREADYTGSTRAFAALHQVMLKRHKVGLALLLARKTSSPQHVIIVAQAEERDEETNKQTVPPGMHLIQIAYKDDIRDMPTEVAEKGLRSITVPEDAEEDDELPAVSLMKNAMKKTFFTEGYNPDNYLNPGIQFHYDCLQAIAFHEPAPEVEDRTLPMVQTIEKRAGKFLKELKQIIAEDPNCVPPPLESYGGKTSNKSRKKEDLKEAGVDKATIILAFKAGKESKIKVADLRAYLADVNVPLDGRKLKPDLIEATREYLKSKGLID